jgi:thiol-disulfide isomerase/thioredoxin
MAVVVAVAVALGIGLVWRQRDGRVRASNRGPHEDGEPVYERLPEPLRERLSDGADDTQVTLLQFSTTFCAPCRHTRILLADLAKQTEGLRHLDVDLTDHPEWSTPLGVHRTPTTLVLDKGGHELFRVAGVPRREELTAALRPHLDGTVDGGTVNGRADDLT